MALARVVSFEGVSTERMDELAREMREGDRPEDLPATEVVMLHDPEGEKSLVILSLRPRTTTGGAMRCLARCQPTTRRAGGRQSRSTTSRFV